MCPVLSLLLHQKIEIRNRLARDNTFQTGVSIVLIIVTQHPTTTPVGIPICSVTFGLCQLQLRQPSMPVSHRCSSAGGSGCRGTVCW